MAIIKPCDVHGHMNKLIVLASVFSVALSFVTTMAYGICPYPTPKFCARYFESDAVFVGEVSDKEYVDDPDLENDTDWIRYTVKVKEVYRGHANTVEKVLTGNDSGRWYGEVGTTYVFFVNGGKTSHTCGPLDKPEYAQEIVRQIDALKNASSATIEGEVLSRSGPWGGPNGIPVRGIRLKVRGGGKEYDSVTDQNGQFSFLLPPGVYTLIAEGLDPSDYNYRHQDLQYIILERGQCAQFQLLQR
jgi:hypothetical protein